MARTARRLALVLTFAGAAATGSVSGQPAPGLAPAAVANVPVPGPLPLFPASNWWNLDIAAAPVDPQSAAFIAFINNGGSRRLHPDFGGYASPGSQNIYGLPYIVVDGSQAKHAVEFYYRDESDGVDRTTGLSVPFYPIPDEAIDQPYWIEGGPPGRVDLRQAQDRHMLIVDRDNRHLYELYNVYHDGSRWHAGSGAFFDLKTNGRRPEGWTSADAAGLAILPGLVRYDEVFGPDEIRHAFRVTVRATNGYVYPASHRAGGTLGALPMGARLRLKASKSLDGFRPEIQKIFRAMKRYGLIVADNGSDLYVTGAFDPRWNNDVLNPAFRSLTASDFEVIQLGWIGGEGDPPPDPAPPPLPGAPTNLNGQVTGATVALAWESPADPGLSGYEIEAGSGPAMADLARVVLPASPRTYVATSVPPGTYYVRVRAHGPAGAGPPSNELRVQVDPGCAPAGAPTDLRVAQTGATVDLWWVAPIAPPAPTSFLLRVGSSAGASDLAVFDTRNPLTTFRATAPPGWYFVRVHARSACGDSAPSNEVAIQVPELRE